MTARRALAIAATALFYAGLTTAVAEKTFNTAADRERLRATADEETAAIADEEPAPGEEGAEPTIDGVTSDTDSGGPLASSAGPDAGAEQPGPRLPVSPVPTIASPGVAVATTAPPAGVIRIGVHDDNPGAAFSEYGVRGGPTGDQQVWIRRVVDWINANGGMGGRRIELVSHITESLNGTFEQQAEQACTRFTEDAKVSVVVGGARVPTLNLVDCLARHNTPLVWDYHFMVDRPTFAKYAGYLYMPSMVSAERLNVWIDAVAESGFFRGGTVGVIRYDNALHKRFVDTVLRPRLAAHGSSITEDVAFSGATGAASAADLSAQANSAILRFRAANVDRVIFVPSSAVIPLLFFAAAEAQTYRPRYTFTTFDNPAFQTLNAPASQLVGSVVFGWTPAGDVHQPQQPPPTPMARRCLQILAGNAPTNDGSARRYCDGFMFLKTVFDRGAEPTPAGIRQVVDSLGDWDSGWALAAHFGPNRHDGASSGRLVVFDGGCSCYRYSGPNRRIP
jgi:ABC-type branched-subunit amino acid transport system substrate-binding protein